MEKENVPVVYCRSCGKQMKQYPYGILAFGCRACKLKATITYEKMPVMKIRKIPIRKLIE